MESSIPLCNVMFCGLWHNNSLHHVFHSYAILFIAFCNGKYNVASAFSLLLYSFFYFGQCSLFLVKRYFSQCYMVACGWTHCSPENVGGITLLKVLLVSE